MRQQGFSLFEIMITLVVVSIVTVLGGTMFLGTVQLQQKVQKDASLLTLKSQLTACAKNVDALNGTVAEISNLGAFACLLPGQSCVGVDGKLAPILLMDSSAGPKPWLGQGETANPRACGGYNNLDPKAGLTPSGQPCFDFDPKGNDRCPFKYHVMWSPKCSDPDPGPGQPATCKRVNIRIVGFLDFRPATPPKKPLNLDLYSFSTQHYFNPLKNEHLLMVDERSEGTPGGSCTANTWNKRHLTSVRYDMGFNLGPNTKPDAVELNPGSYRCSAQAPGYRVNGHQLRITFSDPSIPPAVGTNAFSSTSEGESQTWSVATAAFTILQPTTLTLEQFCQASTGGSDLGVPGGAGSGPSIFSHLECTRVE